MMDAWKQGRDQRAAPSLVLLPRRRRKRQALQTSAGSSCTPHQSDPCEIRPAERECLGCACVMTSSYLVRFPLSWAKPKKWILTSMMPQLVCACAAILIHCARTLSFPPRQVVHRCRRIPVCDPRVRLRARAGRNACQSALLWLCCLPRYPSSCCACWRPSKRHYHVQLQPQPSPASVRPAV